MLTIRLTRKGKKNQPFFRVVLIDKRRSTKGGRAVEDLGYVDPLKKRKNFKKERVLYWISKGAKPSATMHNFLVSEKIIDAKKIHVSRISKKKQIEIDSAKTVEAQKSAFPAKSEVSETSQITKEKSVEPAHNASHSDAGGEAKPAEEIPSAGTSSESQPNSSGQETPVVEINPAEEIEAPKTEIEAPKEEAEKESKPIE